MGYYTMLYLPLFSHYMLCLCEDILIHLIFIKTKCVCAQPLPTLCNPMDYSLPGSSLHEIFQAKIPEWVAISSFREFSWSRGQTHIFCISCIGRWILFHWATWIAQGQNSFPFYGCTILYLLLILVVSVILIVQW